jgi:hypothetical protein
MPCMTRQLESSVATRWRERTAGAEEDLRNWLTRIGYYEAVVAGLRRTTADAFDARTILDEHQAGKPSTLYSIASRSALIPTYLRCPEAPARALGELIGFGPVPHLVAETKVWSFWPFRTVWLREIDEWYPGGDFEPAANRLARRLAEWQAANPELAAAERGLPPICAVEDIMIVSRYALPADRAARLLVRAAQSPAGGRLTVGPPVTDLGPPVRGSDRPLPPADRASLASLVAEIMSAIDLLDEPDPTSADSASSGDVRRKAAELLRAAVRRAGDAGTGHSSP